MNQTMLDYLKALEREGRGITAEAYRLGLSNFQAWLDSNGVADPPKVTFEQLERFQRYMAEDYRSPKREKLGRATQRTRLAAVKGYYRWLYARGITLTDPAKKIRLPKIAKSFVAKDHLTQQEATALLQTQAKRMDSYKDGSLEWAIESRNLAMLSLAIATGRRRRSLLHLRVKDLDFDRSEIRIEWEKGKPGRVLPCIKWAMDAAKEYVDNARSRILNGRKDAGWLFVSSKGQRVCREFLSRLTARVQKQSAEENPDLEGFGEKRLGSHGLRVTFATMLFLNGAGIRDVNELLLHEQLTTTARYTPLELEDLRRACRLAHPRA